MSKEFKVGDKVRVLEDAPRGQFFKGCIYEVSLVYEEDGDTRIVVVADSNGETNGWLADYFELVESFDDLVDVAVKAVRDKVIYSFNFTKAVSGHDLLEVFETSDHKVNDLSHLFNDTEEMVIEGINFIKSLYTETFVIESIEDIGGIKWDSAKATLTNDCEIDLNILDGAVNRSVMLILLKGATVTQKRGK